MIKRIMLALTACAALVLPGVAMAGSASASPQVTCTPGYSIRGGTGGVTYTITRGCAGRSFRAFISNSATLQTRASSWAHEAVGQQRTALLSGGNVCYFQDEPTGHVGGPTRSIRTKC